MFVQWRQWVLPQLFRFVEEYFVFVCMSSVKNIASQKLLQATWCGYGIFSRPKVSYSAINRVNCPVILHCCQCLSSILLFAKFVWNNPLDYSRYPRGNTAPTVLPQMHYRYRGSTVHSVPSPRYYREILPIPTVITAFPITVSFSSPYQGRYPSIVIWCAALQTDWVIFLCDIITDWSETELIWPIHSNRSRSCLFNHPGHNSQTLS